MPSYRHENRPATSPATDGPPLWPRLVLLVVIIASAIAGYFALKELKSKQNQGDTRIVELDSELSAKKEELKTTIKAKEDTSKQLEIANAALKKEKEERQQEKKDWEQQKTKLASERDAAVQDKEKLAGQLTTVGQAVPKLTTARGKLDTLGAGVEQLNQRFNDPISWDERPQMQKNELRQLREQVEALKTDIDAVKRSLPPESSKSK